MFSKHMNFGISFLRCMTTLLILAGALDGQGNTLDRAQIGAAISLKAVLRPSLKVDAESYLITVNLPHGEDGDDILNALFHSEWNVELSTRQVQVVAYFADPANALTDSSGHSIAATSIQACTENGDWKSFSVPMHTGQVGNGLVLFAQTIEPTARVGGRTGSLHLRLRDVVGLPSGTYHGIIHIRIVTL